MNRTAPVNPPHLQKSTAKRKNENPKFHVAHKSPKTNAKKTVRFVSDSCSHSKRHESLQNKVWTHMTFLVSL